MLTFKLAKVPTSKVFHDEAYMSKKMAKKALKEAKIMKGTYPTPAQATDTVSLAQEYGLYKGSMAKIYEDYVRSARVGLARDRLEPGSAKEYMLG